MMATIFNSSILNSAILDSAILHKTLTQTEFNLTQTHSFSLNLMISAILNSAMLDSDTAILDSNTLLSSLRFTQKHSSSTLTLTQTNSIWLTRWWQPSWILPSWIQSCCQLDSINSIFKLIQIHSQPLEFKPSWIPLFAQKNFTHSFWLNLMMAAIMNSAMLDSDTAILDSDTLLSSLRLTQKHSPSILTLTQTNSIWLIHSDSTWWWQPSWILPCWIQTLPSWIQTPCYLLSDELKNTLQLWLWLKLIQSDSNSFILTQLDDGSHLEFCHLGFRHCHLGFKHLVIFSQIHSKTLFTPFWLNWLKLIQSDSLIGFNLTLPSWIQTPWIQTSCYLLSD